jgi:hypothetical protein
MKFKFIGREPSEFMGFEWFPGTEHDVTDEHAIKKLSNSILFEKAGKSAGEPKKASKKAVTDNGDNANAA